MLNIYNLSKAFQGENLFQNISFQAIEGDRIGLIGKNGMGKSTLLKIISGDLDQTTGDISFVKDTKLGFLRQDIEFEEGRTVVEEAQQALIEIKEIETELENLNTEIATRTDYESEAYNELLIQLNDLQSRYEILGGYTYQGKTERILLGLGFKAEDFDKTTDTFSGGWRMRIELAKLLLQDNDLLLLDEPTNHLDIESIVWFERFLQNFEGAVILVSHDKMFLDNTTNRTIEIINGRIYDYKKPYTEYLAFREQLIEQQLAAQKNQQKEIEQTEKLIERFRAKATKASMAQSLIKKLDRIERIEVDEVDTQSMHLQFPISQQPGRVVLEIKDLHKSYGEKEVLKGLDLLVARGSKIAFVGQNGQGKSTLAKCIIGEEDFEGDIKHGHNVEIGYFAQNQSDYLNPNLTVYETLLEEATDDNRRNLRNILGAFLFRDDDVDKLVSVLSGGERNRLALAKLILQPFNVLIMDEPTNHLDIDSKNVVKEALNNFDGTLIIVSHDREFLQGLTEVVYEFKDGGIKEYLGDIDYFLEAKKAEDFRAIEESSAANESSSDKQEQKQISEEERRQRRTKQNRLSRVEREIHNLEQKLEKMDNKLANDYADGNVPADFFAEYEQIKKEIKEYNEEWEELYLYLEDK